MVCAIVGFLPAGRRDFASLLLASEVNGAVPYVGSVGTGFTDRLRARLNSLLRDRVQAAPAVPCAVRRAVWVTPGLFCRVGYLEALPSGELRAAAFEALYENLR